MEDQKLSVAQFRQLAPDATRGLDDQGIVTLRDELYKLADVAVDLYESFSESAEPLDGRSLGISGDAPFYHFMGTIPNEIDDMEEVLQDDCEEEQE